MKIETKILFKPALAETWSSQHDENDDDFAEKNFSRFPKQSFRKIRRYASWIPRGEEIVL